MKSKVIIKNEKQLINFLNILAEESVQQAYRSVNGEKQQQQVARDITMSKKAFIEEEDPPGDTSGKPTDVKTPAGAPASKQADSTGSISPKFDSLIDAINGLRGAPSSKDSSVETQLRADYDKLREAEAASAILLIRSLSQVMKGEIEGALAPNPADYEITTSMDVKKGAESAPDVAAPESPVGEPESPAETESEPEPGPEETGEEEEDTAPPIKVGSAETQQVTEAYRNKIRMLLMGN